MENLQKEKFTFLKKHLKNLVFLVLPLLFLFIGFQYKKEIVYYSLTSVDPEMAYLYNSLTITQGHLPNFVDHPGIPLQYIGAAVIGVAHLFKDSGPLEQDVMLNPDYYIHAISYTLIFLLSLTILFLGYFTRKITNSTIAGLFIQLSPFVSCSYLNLASRLLPEYLSLIVAAVFFIISISYSYSQNIEKKNHLYALYFAIVSGFALSVKITFIPFLIIPLIVLRKFRYKLVFGLELIAATAFFLIPALNRWGYFTGWMKKLFFHSGQYGQGESNILDVSVFKNNLIEIYNNDPLIIFILALTLLGLLLYFLPWIKIKRKKDILFISAVSFTLTTILIILMIAKQLKFYYLSPAYVMAIPSLLLTVLLYERIKAIKKILLPISTIVLAVFIYRLEAKSAIFDKRTYYGENRIITKNFVAENLINVPIANAATYYGSPFPAYSTYYGYLYSHIKRNKALYPVYVKTFPYTYNYHEWNNRFNYWNNEGFTIPEILTKHDSVYLYLGDAEMASKMSNEVLGANRNMDCEMTLLYHNNLTGEKIIKLKHKKEYVKRWMLICDAERVDSISGNISNNQGIIFQGGNLRSDKISLSGKYCFNLTPDNQYACGIFLTDLQKGDHYSISVWKYKNGNTQSGLVISSVSAEKYYKFSASPLSEQGDWYKIQTDVMITEDLDGEDLKIYCWYSSDTLSGFFDDLCIEKIE